MKKGRVARKIEDKGFGFIKADGADYFFHKSQCITPFEDLVLEDDVRFEAEESPKGLRAIDVERI